MRNHDPSAQQRLSPGELSQPAFRKGRELGESLEHQGTRLDTQKGMLIDKYYTADLQSAVAFARQVHEHLEAHVQPPASPILSVAEFTVEIKVSGYLGRCL